MDLDLQIINLRKSITFSIVDDLAELLTVGTAYHDMYIESILCRAQRLRPSNSHSVVTLDAFDSPICNIESEEGKKTGKVYVCRRTVIILKSGAPVLVRSDAAG